jgi:hypothetical protein
MRFDRERIRISLLVIALAVTISPMAHAACGEASCVAAQGAYISHFTGLGCTGTESYYLPYNGFAYQCRPWNGTGNCGTIRRTVTNRSYKDSSGTCRDAWQSGNTLSNFVTVYRDAPGPQPPVACGSVSPFSGSAPLGVWFNAYCSYDPDGGYITSYQWDYWEGISWGSSAYYTYHHPGSYPVWLTVWDDEGQSSTSFMGSIWVY